MEGLFIRQRHQGQLTPPSPCASHPTKLQQAPWLKRLKQLLGRAKATELQGHQLGLWYPGGHCKALPLRQWEVVGELG